MSIMYEFATIMAGILFYELVANFCVESEYQYKLSVFSATSGTPVISHQSHQLSRRLSVIIGRSSVANRQP
jgi:hypothetical protein